MSPAVGLPSAALGKPIKGRRAGSVRSGNRQKTGAGCSSLVMSGLLALLRASVLWLAMWEHDIFRRFPVKHKGKEQLSGGCERRTEGAQAAQNQNEGRGDPCKPDRLQVRTIFMLPLIPTVWATSTEDASRTGRRRHATNAHAHVANRLWVHNIPRKSIAQPGALCTGSSYMCDEALRPGGIVPTPPLSSDRAGQ
jgi:hypothetical protein